MEYILLFNLKAKVYKKKGYKLVIKTVLIKILVSLRGVAKNIEPFTNGATRLIVDSLKVFVWILLVVLLKLILRFFIFCLNKWLGVLFTPLKKNNQLLLLK
jgi:hypothetical protein